MLRLIFLIENASLISMLIEVDIVFSFSCFVEYFSSHSNTEVKRPRARAVFKWETPWDLLMLIVLVWILMLLRATPLLEIWK